MKKWMALFVAAVLLVTLAVPAMAAQTGVYIDEVVDYATTPVAEVVENGTAEPVAPVTD